MSYVSRSIGAHYWSISLPFIDGPKATPLMGPVYTLTASSVNIISYNNVTSNPVPISTWSKDGG